MTTVTDIYIPPNCQSLDKVTAEPQVRLGLQGFPKTGKTWSALTFKNPIVMNLDRGLGAHVGKAGVIEIPFFSPAFIDRIIPRSGTLAPPNRRDAILKWLATEGVRLTESQTLVIDSSTQLQNAFVAEYNLNPKLTKQGKIDDFGLWAQKAQYFGEVCEMIKLLRCDIIYICHETVDRGDDGDLNGKVRPLLTGQFGDQLASHFTDFFRCHAVAKPETPERLDKFKVMFKLSAEDAKEWIESTPKDHLTIYVWQVTSDDICKCGSSTLINPPKYVLANSNSFNKYKRKCS